MGNDFSNILSKLNGSAWFITPEALETMMDILNRRMSGVEMSKAEIRSRLESLDHDRQFASGTNLRGIGVLPLYGPIFPKANLMTEMSGASSLEMFRNDFREMMANDFISTILLDIDSPGGYADMIPEMAQEIREAREEKDIIAVANTTMASAAYYLGSQATRVYATDSGSVGSVGVIMSHIDDSRRDEMEGIKYTHIHAGKYKAEMAGPLSEDSRAHLQSQVDALYDRFVSDVAVGRGATSEEVIENYGQGRMLQPKDAMAVGMIDGIRTFDSVLGRLIESGGDTRALDTHTPVPVSATSTVGYVPTVTDSTAGHVHVGLSYDADKEHSEPGTGQGGEPTPRTPPEEGDKAIQGGWRRDPPPIAYEPQEEEMSREWLEARATALGISFNGDTTDDEIQNLISSRIDEVIAPMAKATAEAEKKLEFAEKFPAEAAKLARLESRDREAEAHKFAESYGSFADEPRKGFSNVVREKIEAAHLKIAERTISHDDLKELLDASSADTAVVTYGEDGSSRVRENATPAAGRTMQETRQLVADLVQRAQTEDGMTQEAAMAHVAAQNPELWNSYIRMQ